MTFITSILCPFKHLIEQMHIFFHDKERGEESLSFGTLCIPIIIYRTYILYLF